jgi:heptosyltransferase I
MPARPPDSICVIRLSAIGDCCHTLAVIRSIQSAWPQTRITWIIGKVEYELMKGINDIEFIIFDKSAGWRGYFDVRRRLRDRRFPVILHMHASMRANLLTHFIRADRVIGYDRARARDYQWLFTNEQIPAVPRQHVLDTMFSFIEHLELHERDLRWNIPVPEQDQQFARDICCEPGPTCIISPCSSHRFRNFRNWSVERYIELGNYLVEKYAAQIILTGGTSELEKEYGQGIEAGITKTVTNLVGATNLKQLIALIDCSEVVICPDSGPAHIAATVGTPVVGLYATSNRRRTGPYFSQHLVADRYPDAIEQEFGKPIEDLRWGQRVRNPDAMNLILVGDVTEKIDLVLNPARTGRYPTPDLT